MKLCLAFIRLLSCADPGEGVRGFQITSLENHKAICRLMNTCPHLMENNKAIKPAFNAGPLSAPAKRIIFDEYYHITTRERSTVIFQDCQTFKDTKLDAGISHILLDFGMLL